MAEEMRELPANWIVAFLSSDSFIAVFTAWMFLGEKVPLLRIGSGIVIINEVIMVNRKQ